MSFISVQLVETYDPQAVQAAVNKHFNVLSVAQDLTPETRVLIKPNLLTGVSPERCVTTHPVVLSAVITWLRGQGISKIVVADSPGGLYTPAKLKSIYGAAGYLIPEIEPWLNYDCSYRQPSTHSESLHGFNVITPVLEADYIINLPKLKTHGMTLYSGGIKNLFGVIPGIQKPEMHYRFPSLESFSQMLVDLAVHVRPNITLIDGIDGMEGNGPSGGTVRHAGVLLASRDIFSLDWAAASFMGIEPSQVMMLDLACNKGYICPENIQFSAPLTPLSRPFELPDTIKVDFTDKFPAPIRKFVLKAADRLLRPVPQVNPKLCIGCGKCMESCPPHVIQIKNRKAQMQRKGCISCFCCQEMCPVQAISAKRIVRF